MTDPERMNCKPELLLRVVDERDFNAAIGLVRSAGQYAHVVYHMPFRTMAPTDMPFIRTTYPSSWLGHYVQQQYQHIDPVILDGFNRIEPFFWDELDRRTPDHEAFFKDAEAHGAGRTGFSIPLSDKSNRKALFSVTSNLPDAEWHAKIAEERETLLQVGDVLHRKAVQQVYGSDPGPALAPREIECLYWTALGKDGPTLSGILGISEHTVRDYLKTARLKLGCHTIAQAIAEATKRRLITF